MEQEDKYEIKKDEHSISSHSQKKPFIDNLVDLIFSINSASLILLAIIFLALVLRIIAAINLGVAADDMHFAIHAINFLHSGKLVVYDQSAGLWYYLTSIFYNIFGATQLGSRFAAVLFGSFSVIFMFLLVKEFFGEKAGLIAAFLLAVSPFHIKNTIAEMDVLTLFFILGAFVFLIYALKREKKAYFALSGIFIGIAIYTKFYSNFFVLVMLAYSFYYRIKIENKKIDKGFIKKIFIMLFLAGLFLIPSLTHNYLLYKDKGIADFLYTTTLNIGREKGAQYYSWDAGWNGKADFLGFFLGNSVHVGTPVPSAIVGLSFLFYPDILIAVLGLIGLIFLFIKKKKEHLMLSLFILIFVFFYLASRMLLSKHYLFLLIIAIPAASYLLSTIHEKFSKIRLRYLLALILIFQLIYIGYLAPTSMGQFYGKSEVQQMIEYKSNSISKDALIIADARIYRGEIHWMFNGNQYLEASYFPQLMQSSEQATNQSIGKNVQMDAYFIECAIDDCGWGTIKDQPDFNKSMEDLVSFFQNSSTLEKEIFSPKFSGKTYYPFMSKPKQIYFRVYKTTININPAVLPSIRSTYTWFLYPIGYDEKISTIFDKYEAHSPIDSLLNRFAHLIVYLAIFLSFFSIFLAIYLLLKENQNEKRTFI